MRPITPTPANDDLARVRVVDDVVRLRAGRRPGTRARPGPRAERVRERRARRAREHVARRARAPPRRRRARCPSRRGSRTAPPRRCGSGAGSRACPARSSMCCRPVVTPPARDAEAARAVAPGPAARRAAPRRVVAVHDPLPAAARPAGSGSGPASASRCERMARRHRVVDPGRARPQHARARQVAELGRPPLAEREHVHRLVAGDQRVRARVRPVDEAVARAHLVRLPRAPREPAAREHVEDLLLGAVVVRGRRAACRARSASG